MEIKTDPNVEGLIKALKEHGIKEIVKEKRRIIIDSKGKFFLEGVLPPGKNGERKRVIRFSKLDGDIVDPTLFGFKARKAKKGLKILIRPLSKKNSGDLQKPPSFWLISTF